MQKLRHQTPRLLMLTLLIFTCIWYFGCATYQAQQKTVPTPEYADSIHIMAYNVENLFDTKKDAGKDDHAYLSVTAKQTPAHKAYCESLRFPNWQKECLEQDWSEPVLQTKLQRLSDVVFQLNKGRGPDILILEEIENLEVLNQWAHQHLQKAQYQSRVLIEGQDSRGIDVAILSRFPLVGKAKLHRIPFQVPKTQDKRDPIKDTRGILEAHVQLPDQSIITIFAVHFPAPYHPSSLRAQAVAHLNHLLTQLPPDRLAIAGGDFNITSEEENKEQFFAKHLSEKWMVSHLIGCKNCLGTNYYPAKKQWSFLDAILFSKSFQNKLAKWQIAPETVQVPTQSAFQTDPQKIGPARFDEKYQYGVSDHWPIAVQIRPRSVTP